MLRDLWTTKKGNRRIIDATVWRTSKVRTYIELRYNEKGSPRTGCPH